jgi:hypothetical protein
MKAKHIFYTVFVVLALGLVAASIFRSAFFIPPKSDAGGFGIAPPQIILDDLHRGAETQAEIMLLRSDGNSVQQISAVLSPATIANWVSVPSPEILFPAGKTKQLVRFNIKVPDDALPGNYEGSAIFKVLSPGNAGGVAVSLGAKAIIKITIVPEINKLKTFTIADNAGYEKYQGQVVIKPEDNYQTYYISPTIAAAYFLENEESCQLVISQYGIGISNQLLNLIPLGLEPQVGDDTDGDRLADRLEDAIGTDKYSRDTDRDLFNDYGELLNGYDPRGAGALTLDLTFSAKQAGRIFLQVENRGEAWYINPADNKRYFLGKAGEALFVFRQLGTDVTNQEFEGLFGKLPLE